jgi:hypothetical protein
MSESTISPPGMGLRIWPQQSFSAPVKGLFYGCPSSLPCFKAYTAKLLVYRKFETYIPRKGTGHWAVGSRSPNSSTFMFLCAIYIFPWWVCIFCCRKVGGPIVGIYKSLTDAWMWKLDYGRAVPFLGMHKTKFLYSLVDNVPLDTARVLNIRKVPF